MTPNKTFLRCAAGPALAAFAFLAQANTIPGGVAPEERMLVEQGYGGFLTAHPDLRHNKRGLTAFLDGDYEKAARSFRLAARYADKPSQALIAEMLWEGKGSAQDRPLAYAWADLAAERGERRLVLQREHYWEQMSESERALAIERGEAVYAEFGDAVAQPRLARVLRRASRNLAGSRTGYTGNATMLAPAVGKGAAVVTVQAYPISLGGNISAGSTQEFSSVQASQSLPAKTFFASRYWSPDVYLSWRDGYLERKLQSGTVEVGGVRKAEAPEDESDDR